MYKKGQTMKTIIIIIAIVILGLGGLFFITQNKNSSADTPKLTMQSINSNIASGGQLIDVRTPAEYTAGHIDGAINLSLQDIQAGTMPTASKDKPIYLYCHSGNRSNQATIILKSAGYQKITDLGAITNVQSLGGTIKT